MSNTVDQNIQIKCPDLYSDANKQLWINNAILSTDADCYGDKYTLAVALRACHDYTMSTLAQGAGSGSAGPVISKREGDLSITFANNSSNYSSGDDYLSQTPYGRELLSIQKGTLPRISSTGNTAEVSICCIR
jgi:hypothetical protein